MEDRLVPLTATSGRYLRSVIEAALKQAGIPYVIQDHGIAEAFGEGRMTKYRFLVPASRLQEGKDVLCANGIACDISERLLRRALEEIVRPILDKSDRDLSRFARFVEVNNKETVKALFDAVLAEEGGRLLLEDLFFRIDRPEDLSCLRSLARALGPVAGAAFHDRLRVALTAGSMERRLALIEVLPRFPPTRARAEAIALALRDPLLEIREAEAEAIFALGKGDYGYDPEGPEEDRESAIEDFLSVSG